MNFLINIRDEFKIIISLCCC